MNKKSKKYIGIIIVTVIAVSLVMYEVKSKNGNSDILVNKEDVLTWEEEKNLNTDKDNVELSELEESTLESNPIGEKIRNSFNYPDKEDIHFKMFNAVDNFNTVTGTFFEESTMDNNRMESTFAVDTKNKTSVTTDKTEGREPITLIYYDDKRMVYDDNDKSYREFEEKQSMDKPILARPIRLFLNPELKREDVGYLGVSHFIISSESIPNMLFIYEDWDYTDSEFLGRDVYKLEGKIDAALSSMCEGKFSLLMDKETGIVLQFLCFDENGEVKYKIECTELQVNTDIDESIYNKDTYGYVKK